MNIANTKRGPVDTVCPAMPLRFLLLILLAVVSGCSTTGTSRDVKGSVASLKPLTEIPEDQLLDVWIEVFDPGELPEDEEDASGLSLDIRDAESRYMPVQLRNTMEKTGYWGAVRVVPQGTGGGEVMVRGAIQASDGEQLVLRITALDATGRQWFSNTYESGVSLDSYQDQEQTMGEVFQPLYNTIANDLVRFRTSLSASDILSIRRVAELRFAGDLVPDAFGAHLKREDNGHYTVTRLPAVDDPMYRRVKTIRERDFLLIDTLNGHFDNFYREMQKPYGDWRRTRTEEATALRKIKRDATRRKVIGVAAIAGAIAIEALGNGNTRASTGVLRDVMVVGGAYALKTGFDKDSETLIHKDAIEELGESFSSETRPLVVDVEGETHELSGSAEVQYTKWRALLRRLYSAETGLDSN